MYRKISYSSRRNRKHLPKILPKAKTMRRGLFLIVSLLRRLKQRYVIKKARKVLAFTQKVYFLKRRKPRRLRVVRLARSLVRIPRKRRRSRKQLQRVSRQQAVSNKPKKNLVKTYWSRWSWRRK